MDRIDAMRLFCRITERASFAQAARDLQMARPTASNAIKELEEAIGVRLLHRTTRNIRLTDEGKLYYDHCIRLLADFDQMHREVGRSDPQGPLRVDVQGTMARFFVMPRLYEFVSRYPGVEMRISESDRMVDMIEEGVDCVLRAGSLSDSSMVCRRLGHFPEVTCASPNYLERHAAPETPDDLDGHKMVAYLASSTGKPYPLDFSVGGEMREVSLPYDVAVTGAEIYTAAALGGLGIIQAPYYHMREYLQDGRLVRLLADYPPCGMPLSVLYPERQNLSDRVRTFVDWLATIFSEIETEPRHDAISEN